MIPLWKVKRELGRLGQQLQAIPEAVWEPFAQRFHDRDLQRGFPVTEGALPERDKIAIVLCWQPGGLVASFLMMLDHLHSAGYAPFVVSNAPLSVADHDALRPRAWRVMERPNFGYDFGGYRDGLAMLRRWEVVPKRVVILNDSIWFPLWPGDRTLERMEAAPFDVVGTILRAGNGVSFLESYFFSINGAVLADPGFRAFWDELGLTSNKYKVIRRGERGFGVALTHAGISMGPLFSADDFLAGLAQADDATLRTILRFAAHADRRIVTKAHDLAAEDPDATWRTRADNFLRGVLDRAQFYSTFPVGAAMIGYPVLKKSSEPVGIQWRAAFLRAVETGDIPPLVPDLVDEIAARTLTSL